MIEELRELWRYRELLLVMVQRELRIRYKNSALGFLWSFINPLLTTFVFWLVFGVMLGYGTSSNYSAYILAAYLPFMFFQFAVLDSAQSILTALPVIRKVYLPRELLPLAAIIGNLIHLGIGFVVFFLYLFFNYARTGFAVSPFMASTWLLLPLMLISFCLATGVGLLVSALNTFYEDVKYVTTVGMSLLFYVCPVVYFYETITNRLDGTLWYRLYMFNPQAALCVAYRKALLPGISVPTLGKQEALPAPMPWNYVAYSAVTSILILILGYHVFNQLKWRFVERP